MAERGGPKPEGRNPDGRKPEGGEPDRRKKVVLGVTGGIGAYRAPELVRSLVKRGHRVQVVLTRAAASFVSPLSLATVSGEPVLGRLFGPPDESGYGDTGDPAAPADPAVSGDSPGDIRHISLTEETDLFLVAPATAHTIARLALGLADDFLTTFALAVRAPTLLAPAMNTNMLEHPATAGHLETLRARGVRIVPAGSGELACGWLGPGRLAENEEILAAVEAALGGAPDPAGGGGLACGLAGGLSGRRVLVAAGPTREPLDPVRFLSNRSSGRMGFALARAALARGARVTLVLGPGTAPPPPGCEVVPVETAREMRSAVLREAPGCGAVLMAAAVADYRPAEPSAEKTKSGKSSGRPNWKSNGKSSGGGDERASLALAPNPDILAELGALRREGGAGPAVLVGFAAETGDPEAEAIRKLRAKGCDLVAGNRVGGGRVFDRDTTEAVLVEREPDGGERVTRRPPESKDALAAAILSAVSRRLAESAGPS